jgi:hypothetical protein
MSRIALLLAVLGAAAPAAAAPPEMAPPPELSQLPRTEPASNDQPGGPFPSPPPVGSPRTVSLGLSLGPGWLALRDREGRDGQRAIGFGARLGGVVAPQWNMFLGVDRTSTRRGEARFAQTAALLGAQRFLFGWMYLGGAVSVAMVQESGVPNGLTDGPGFGFSGHVGVELFRVEDAALTGELTLTMVRYPQEETWEMGGLRLGLVLF